MYAARPVLRSSLPRAARSARPRASNVRFQSTTSAAASSMSPLTAGLLGGVAASAAMYGVWYMTPSGRASRGFNKAAYEANKKYNEATKKLQAATPDTNEAIEYVKGIAYSYVAWIPGGRKYLDTAFADIDKLREEHGGEVDKIVKETYGEIQQASKSGLSTDTLYKTLEALGNFSKKIASLAGDAMGDILENHPQLKDKVGGSLDQLKQMGEQYGPEAKKEVDQTWDQVKEIMAGGLSASTIWKAKKLIEDKVETVKKLGDEAWSKGMETAKPLLDKNPKVKELIESNADALKSGNAKELFEKVSSSLKSGKTDELESYVNSALDKAKSKGSQMGFGPLDQYIKMIPGGGDIIPKLTQLKEIAEKHKDEGEALLKETMEEIQQVVAKKAKKAQDLADKAKKEAKGN
ncbi:hypothetical protein MBLNU459_g3983t1 [Dothideomycetes sp. NU459]